MKVNLKGEKGSVTVFVLSIMLFIAAILAITYMSVIEKLTTEEKKMNRIQNEYIADNIDEEYQKALQRQSGTEGEDTNTTENTSNTYSSTQGTANTTAVRNTNTLE